MKHFRNILYVNEPSVEQEFALARAVSLAESNQADLTVIDVIPQLTAGIGLPPGGPISADLQARAEAESRRKLEALVAPSLRSAHQTGMKAIEHKLHESMGAETYDYLSPHYHLIQGPAQQVIPQTAERLGVDLVVMGTLGRTGVAGFFIGNTAEMVLEQLKCSVLAIKPPGFVSPVAMGD